MMQQHSELSVQLLASVRNGMISSLSGELVRRLVATRGLLDLKLSLRLSKTLGIRLLDQAGGIRFLQEKNFTVSALTRRWSCW